jgi:hypothetical protein
MAVEWSKVAYESDVVTKALLTATGDLIYASAPSVPAALADVAVGSYLASGGIGVAPVWATLNQAAVAGLTTASSPEFVTVKLTSLTDGYVPYHVSDAAGLANSAIFQSSGNVGFNTTDIEAWVATLGAMELGGGSAIAYTRSGAGLLILANAYYDGAYKRKGSDLASAHRQYQGVHYFYTAATGAANSEISWITALTIGPTGGVHVGGTSDPGDNNLLVDGTITAAGELYPTGGIAGETENISEDIRYGNEIFPGSLLPYADNTYNLGSATYRWANLYTADLHLKNDRGDYTIVEGEDDLYLRNNRTNKTYRFMLEEVSCG